MAQPVITPVVTEEPKDLGFGSALGRPNERRLLNRDGSFSSRRDGLPFWGSLNAFHFVLNLTWGRFFALVIASYIGINTLFALGYLACGPDALTGASAESFGGTAARAFFFSVETLGTIGYGNVAPVGFMANLLVTVESISGLLGLALGTGVLFARFSRPVAKVIFSDQAVVTPWKGKTAFMFRLANGRKSQLIELEIKVLFSRIENGIRRYDPLTLERTRVVFFPLAWTVVHPIDEASPLWGLTAKDLADRETEFLVLLSGIDETFSQMVHARSSYKAEDIVAGRRFVSMYNPLGGDGVVSIDMRKLSDTEPAGDTPANGSGVGRVKEFTHVG